MTEPSESRRPGAGSRWLPSAPPAGEAIAPVEHHGSASLGFEPVAQATPPEHPRAPKATSPEPAPAPATHLPTAGGVPPRPTPLPPPRPTTGAPPPLPRPDPRPDPRAARPASTPRPVSRNRKAR